MNIIDRLFGLLDGKTPEEAEASFQETRKDFFDDYSPAERRQMEADDNANYVEHIRGHNHRETWYTNDGLTLNWREYVIDQRGKKHIVNTGSHYVGFSGFGTSSPEIVQGEIVDEYIPVYKRLQG